MNRSRPRLKYCIIALLGLAATPPAWAASSPDWQVVTAQITQNKNLQTYRHVAIAQWSLGGALSGTRGNGAAINLSSDDIVSLRNASSTQSPTLAQWRLFLRNGDSLVGTPSSIAAGAMSIQSPLLGKLTFPLGLIAGLRRAESRVPTTVAHDHDTIYFLNGDKLDGVLEGLTATAAKFDSSLGESTLPLTRIACITLGGLPAPAQKPTLTAQLFLRDGSRLTVSELIMNATGLHAATTEHQPFACSMGDILKLHVQGGRLTWLAALPFASEQTTLFGMQWPVKINSAVTGRIMRVDGVRHHHGLGVHVNCRLTFSLSGQYTTLRLIPAMDDSAKPWGQAQLKIVADGKLLYDQPHAIPDGSAVPLILSMAGVKTLELSASDDQHDGVRGRVDWAAAALLK
ncbi:MAG: hypothetical protein HKL96_05625 [Phycisphaerales bacterium]|nr:hypothetical protein [Phycisphaerales bacterium]